MSSLIEQAIIDAKELREAALRTAESQIIEKYSSELKEAMNSILEKEHEDDEEDLDDLHAREDITLDADTDTGELDEIGIDTLGISSDTPGLVSLDMDSLADAVKEYIKSERDELDNLEQTIDAKAANEPPPQEIEITDVALTPDEQDIADMALEPEDDEELPEDFGILGEASESQVNEEGTLDMSEEEVRSIVERLVVDITDGDFTGWAGRPEKDVRYQEEINLARLAATEAQEELQNIKAGMDRLALTNESLESRNTKLTETISAMKDMLEEVNLSNAKLIYQNKSLTNTSLNRRQKNEIVESIRNAKSVEDAKVIFETLQSAVSGRKSSRVESLNEAIKRPSHVVPRREIARNNVESELKNRFQLLAGIQNNK
tara:strand:+ start:1135 stop:2262 length:1128 start_codon:yes stop_codon:yes gene_type:complete